MRFVKRISLFFIYPLTMFSVGFVANMAIMEYFYPGQNTDLNMPSIDVQPEALNFQQQNLSMEVVAEDEPIVTANTRYIVQKYHAETGQVVEEELVAPDKYIGLTRERLARELDEYNTSPPLSEQEAGFVYIELVTFSPARIVVRKSYEEEEIPENEKGFFLLNEDHYVVVYDYSLEHLYMNTGILVEELPESLQEEIIHMKYVESEAALYNFLESFSS